MSLEATMRSARYRILKNGVLAAGILIAVGARTGEQPAPIEASGEATGNVVALSVERPDGASDVVLLVDEDRPGDVLDGRVDRGFLLQGASAPGGDVLLDLTYARVKWDARRVEVLRSGREVLGFGVSQGSPEDDDRIAGHGLSHSSAWEARIPVDGTLASESLAELRKGIVAALAVCEEFDCRAGGEGSLFCGYSCGGESCTAACDSGRFSCCGCSAFDGKPCCKCR